jgi:PAS domain S-box-containing protein
MGSESLLKSDLFLAEEDKVEKFVNYVRVGVSLMFFGFSFLIRKEIPPQSQFTMYMGSSLYFAFSLFMLFFLRAGKYRPWIKFMSISVDIVLGTWVIWNFGSFRTFKTEAFVLYYLWVGVSAMRFSPWLTLFSGGLAVACYLSIIFIAVSRGSIELGTITESFTTPKVSGLNLAVKIIYVALITGILTYVSRVNRRLIQTSVESEEKFRGLVEQARVGVYIIQDERLAYVNPRMAEIFGYSQAEGTGMDMDGIAGIVGEDAEALKANMALRLSGKIQGSRVYRAVRKDGAPIAFEVNATPTVYRGRPAIIGTLDEITDRLRAQEELIRKTQENVRLQEESARIAAVSKLKSQFLATMSHELRTPLNAILGLGQVLDQCAYGPLTEKQSEYTGGIIQSAGHLLSLINDILDLSKIEAGHEKIEPRLFSMDEVLRGSIVLVKERAARLGVEVEPYAGPPVGNFFADERRVKQILYNLLSNAVRFTPRGGRVGLKVRRDAAHLCLEVSDTGIGIPDGMHEMIFESFTQIDSTLGREREGTGLGLALTRRLVEMHGGYITLRSAEGRGSTFTVWLPVVDVADALDESKSASLGSAALVSPAPEAVDRARPLRVMVVEDNPLNMLLLADFMRKSGFMVTEATGGEEALDLSVRGLPPDIMLVDIQMPGMDGIDLARKLKAVPLTAGVPLVAVTALAMKGDEERCREAGFDDYVQKPIDLERLLGVVLRVTGRA